MQDHGAGAVFAVVVTLAAGEDEDVLVAAVLVARQAGARGVAKEGGGRAAGELIESVNLDPWTEWGPIQFWIECRGSQIGKYCNRSWTADCR